MYLQIFSEKCSGHKYIHEIVRAFLGVTGMNWYIRVQITAWERGTHGTHPAYQLNLKILGNFKDTSGDGLCKNIIFLI